MEKKDMKILIVEDMAITLLDLKRTVTKLGYKNVYTATNYHDAMNLFFENNFDIILMDINLGARHKMLDGINLIKEFKNLKDIFKVVYISAYNDEKTVSMAASTNPIGFISKPFSENKLKKYLTAILQRLNT